MLGKTPCNGGSVRVSSRYVDLSPRTLRSLRARRRAPHMQRVLITTLEVSARLVSAVAIVLCETRLEKTRDAMLDSTARTVMEMEMENAPELRPSSGHPRASGAGTPDASVGANGTLRSPVVTAHKGSASSSQPGGGQGRFRLTAPMPPMKAQPACEWTVSQQQRLRSFPTRPLSGSTTGNAAFHSRKGDHSGDDRDDEPSQRLVVDVDGNGNQEVASSTDRRTSATVGRCSSPEPHATLPASPSRHELMSQNRTRAVALADDEGDDDCLSSELKAEADPAAHALSSLPPQFHGIAFPMATCADFEPIVLGASGLTAGSAMSMTVPGPGLASEPGGFGNGANGGGSGGGDALGTSDAAQLESARGGGSQLRAPLPTHGHVREKGAAAAVWLARQKARQQRPKSRDSMMASAANANGRITRPTRPLSGGVMGERRASPRLGHGHESGASPATIAGHQHHYLRVGTGAPSNLNQPSTGEFSHAATSRGGGPSAEAEDDVGASAAKRERWAMINERQGILAALDSLF